MLLARIIVSDFFAMRCTHCPALLLLFYAQSAFAQAPAVTLEILASELVRTMQLCGVARIAEIDRSLIAPQPCRFAARSSGTSP